MRVIKIKTSDKKADNRIPFHPIRYRAFWGEVNFEM